MNAADTCGNVKLHCLQYILEINTLLRRSTFLLVQHSLCVGTLQDIHLGQRTAEQLPDRLICA